MNKLFPFLAFSILLLVPIGSQNAFGVISTFTDKTTFLTATSATSATGALPNLGKIAGDAAASQIVGTVTFTITPPSSELFIGASGVGGVPGSDWTLVNPGPDIAISDIENLNVDLAAPVFSLGFDIVEPSFGSPVIAGTGFTDTTFGVTLKNGPTTVGSFQFNAPDDILAFLGVQSDTAFDRVEIRDITATNDDEFFGEFYTGNNPLPPGPPTTLTKISGDSQSGVVGIPLSPFVVQVTDEFGIPVPDIFVSFELIPLSGAQLSCANAVTDSQGMASCTLTPQEEGDFDVIISVFGSSIIEPVTCSASGFFESQVIGGEIIPIESTTLLLASAQSFSWMIPVVLSVLGIGLFVFRKSENS